MKKIAEMTMNELTACISKLSDPAERLFSDNVVIETLEDFRKQIPEKANVQTAFSLFMSVVLPVLTDEKHKKDTYAILNAMCGEEAMDIEARNGLEVMRDLFVVFALEKDVETLFRPGCEARG